STKTQPPDPCSDRVHLLRLQPPVGWEDGRSPELVAPGGAVRRLWISGSSASACPVAGEPGDVSGLATTSRVADWPATGVTHGQSHPRREGGCFGRARATNDRPAAC